MMTCDLNTTFQGKLACVASITVRINKATPFALNKPMEAWLKNVLLHHHEQLCSTPMCLLTFLTRILLIRLYAH